MRRFGTIPSGLLGITAGATVVSAAAWMLFAPPASRAFSSREVRPIADTVSAPSPSEEPGRVLRVRAEPPTEAGASTTRSTAAGAPLTLAELPRHVRDNLLQSREDIEEYRAYEAQRAETRGILAGLSAFRLHEDMRSVRFSVEEYVGSTLRSRHPMSAGKREQAEAALRPICRALAEEKRRLWETKPIRGTRVRTYGDRAEIDLARREAWLALEAKYGARIRAADARLRALLDTDDVVLAR